MRPAYPTIAWPTTGKTSAPFSLNGNQLVGFIMPSTIASTAVTFNMALNKDISSSMLSITWVPVSDAAVSSAATTLSFTIASSTARYYGFSQDQICKLSGTEIIQMAANSSETANQSIQLVLLPRPSM
jgi:hypothetical protein